MCVNRNMKLEFYRFNWLHLVHQALAVSFTASLDLQKMCVINIPWFSVCQIKRLIYCG